MPLLIVEGPGKIKKLKSILGPSFEVMATAGHFLELEKKNMGIDLETFETKDIMRADKKDLIKKIKEEAKKHSDVYIATDDDPEGHRIGFDLKHELKGCGATIHRVLFHGLNKTEVINAIKNPVIFDENILYSQKARRITDRLVGFKISPVMWSKGLKKTSAGRVQSATLKWIVEREKEIRSFVKEEYWTIAAQTKDFSADFFGFDGKKEKIKNEKAAKQIIDDLDDHLVVSKYSQKTRNRSPEPPFTTASVIKDSNTTFGWNSDITMRYLQTCYEKGLISYHRTDSVRVAPERIIDLRDRIDKQYGSVYLPKMQRNYKNSDSSLDAHEAITPLFEPIPSDLGTNERKLVELITNRFFASQMADAVFDQASIQFVSGKSNAEFRVNGSILKFDGFLKVYGSSTKDVVLPSLKVGDKFKITKINPKQHFTSPPARYTDASFTEKMESEEVGRPSTYGIVANLLIDHGYAIREGKALKPTEIGIMVSDYLDEFFNSMTDAKFTAQLLSKMDKIAAGKLEFLPMMKEFLQHLESEIEQAKCGDPRKLFTTEVECKKCNDGSKMIKKVGDHGVFLGCENHPKCGHTLTVDEDGKYIEKEIETGIPCPVCSNILIKKNGKFGEFYACSQFQICDWKGKLDADGNPVVKKAAEKTEHKCPNCKDGYFVVRTYNSTEFYGCSGYPKCKTSASIGEDGKPVIKEKAIKTNKKAAKITGEKCPKCKSDLAEKNGKYGLFIACTGYPKCKFIKKGE